MWGDGYSKFEVVFQKFKVVVQKIGHRTLHLCGSRSNSRLCKIKFRRKKSIKRPFLYTMKQVCPDQITWGSYHEMTFPTNFLNNTILVLSNRSLNL